jgi:hypothetical protein
LDQLRQWIQQAKRLLVLEQQQKQASPSISLDQLVQQAKPRLVDKGNVMNPATSQQVSKALRYLADLSSSVDVHDYKKGERLYPQLPPTPKRQKKKTPLLLPSAPPFQSQPPSYEQSMRRKTANTSIQSQPPTPKTPLSLPSAPPRQSLPSFQSSPSYEKIMRRKTANTSTHPQPPSYEQSMMRNKITISSHLEKVKQVYSNFLLEKKMGLLRQHSECHQIKKKTHEEMKHCMRYTY